VGQDEDGKQNVPMPFKKNSLRGDYTVKRAGWYVIIEFAKAGIYMRDVMCPIFITERLTIKSQDPK